MKNVAKLFSSFVLVLALSQTVFGGDDGDWVYNQFTTDDSLIIGAMSTGKINNQSISRVGIGTRKPRAALHVNVETKDIDGVYSVSDSGKGVYGSHGDNFNYGYLGSKYEGVTGVVFGNDRSNQAAGILGMIGILGIPFGMYAYAPDSGIAGYFDGLVSISGNLFKSGGGFKIDHPLDPANKYLYHSFVESPDMKNIYDGVVVLDKNGEAWVKMDDWFETLNKNFCYQLTAIGAPEPNLYVAKEISNNRFKISGGTPGIKISWQITGTRQDRYATAHRIPVEQEKPKMEKGYYLRPDVFRQPKEKSINWARNGDLMKRITEDRKMLKDIPRDKDNK